MYLFGKIETFRHTSVRNTNGRSIQFHLKSTLSWDLIPISQPFILICWSRDAGQSYY